MTTSESRLAALNIFEAGFLVFGGVLIGFMLACAL